MHYLIWAIILIAQQLTQTLSMRSRSSGSYSYHALCAVLSNGTWYISQLIMVDQFMGILKSGNKKEALLLGLFYVVWTVVGSVGGMILGIRYLEKRFQ